MFLPSLELMKSSLLHRFPHVAFTCLAFLSWLAGPVITQHKTRTFSAIWSATCLSSGKWQEFGVTYKLLST